MARQPQFNRESALEYLKGRPETQGRKPLEQLKTAELTRKARTAEKAEREGRAFSNKEARGHAGNVSGRANPITHIDPKNPPVRKPGWKYQQDQFVVGRKERPATNKDIQREIQKVDAENRKRAGKSVKDFTPRDELTVYVYGLYKKSGLKEPKTLSKRANRARINQALSLGDTKTAMNFLFDYDAVVTEEVGEGWLEVWSVSVVTGEYEEPGMEENE